MKELGEISVAERILTGELPPPGKVIVEIGHGKNPFPASGRRKLSQHDLYLGIESSNKIMWATENPIRLAIDGMQSLQPEYRPHFMIMPGEGDDVPLDDSSADEVFLGNVFGFLGQYDPKVDSIIQEVGRIVKPYGILRVLENITPSNQGRITRAINSKGFRPVNEHKWWQEEEMLLYNAHGSNRNAFAYILEFQKLPNPA
jgi:SAM-dependent methyltransferase